MQRLGEETNTNARGKGSHDTDQHGRIEQQAVSSRDHSTACRSFRSSLSRALELFFSPNVAQPMQEDYIDSNRVKLGNRKTLQAAQAACLQSNWALLGAASCHPMRSEVPSASSSFLPAKTPPLSHSPASAEPAARAMMAKKAARRAILVVLLKVGGRKERERVLTAGRRWK